MSSPGRARRAARSWRRLASRSRANRPRCSMLQTSPSWRQTASRTAGDPNTKLRSRRRVWHRPRHHRNRRPGASLEEPARLLDGVPISLPQRQPAVIRLEAFVMAAEMQCSSAYWARSRSGEATTSSISAVATSERSCRTVGGCKFRRLDFPLDRSPLGRRPSGLRSQRSADLCRPPPAPAANGRDASRHRHAATRIRDRAATPTSSTPCSSAS